MPSLTRIALIQHCAGVDVLENMATLEAHSRAAAEQGAEFILWPEAFAYLGSHSGKQSILEHLPQGGPILARTQALAQTLNCELLLGGFHERDPESTERCYNTSVLLGSDGAIKASYRKIHLFDVDIQNGPRLAESKHTSAGDATVVTNSCLGKLGLSICYDLRFPQLYQHLVDQGARAITVPSAFTATTGAMHWHALLRARAIECQCYIIAPAQHGQHSEHRASYGHSLVVDPWGEVVAELPEGDGFLLADLNMELVDQVRSEIPSLANRRQFK